MGRGALKRAGALIRTITVCEQLKAKAYSEPLKQLRFAIRLSVLRK